MITINNKKLKELLARYPDETPIYICDNNCGGSIRDVTVINIEYIGDDDYQLPQITLG